MQSIFADRAERLHLVHSTSTVSRSRLHAVQTTFSVRKTRLHQVQSSLELRRERRHHVPSPFRLRKSRVHCVPACFSIQFGCRTHALTLIWKRLEGGFPLPHGPIKRLAGVFGVLKIESMSGLLDRITVDPKQCGGRPCIRGMRIRVVDVLDLYAAGLDANQILAEMPDLEADDLKACIAYARRRVDHPVMAA